MIIKFFKQIILFVALGLVGYIGFYYLLDKIYNTKSEKDTIFIWGDSQAYRGINLKRMNELTGKQIYTAAQLGAGVYDFLVFTQSVPENSEVIIALSKPVQLRRKEVDRNRSGISIKSLILLYLNNYSFSEIKEIMEKNLIPPRLFESYTELYPNADSIVFSESLSQFEEIYAKKPKYLDNKQILYLKGIQNLKHKKCSITFIEFPYHSILSGVEKKSVINAHTENFKNEVAALFTNCRIDSINLDSPKAIMYDLTHLNHYGATKLTERLVFKMESKQFTTMYIAYNGKVLGNEIHHKSYTNQN